MALSSASCCSGWGQQERPPQLLHCLGAVWCSQHCSPPTFVSERETTWGCVACQVREGHLSSAFCLVLKSLWVDTLSIASSQSKGMLPHVDRVFLSTTDNFLVLITVARKINQSRQGAESPSWLSAYCHVLLKRM